MISILNFSKTNRQKTNALAPKWRKCVCFFITQNLLRKRLRCGDFGNEEHIGWYKPVYLGFIHQTVPNF